MKPSTEALLLAMDLVIRAACEKRTDLTNEILMDITELKSKIQYLQEIECE